MPIITNGVHHIMVTVGAIDVAKEFYENIIGLEEIDCPVKDGIRIWYKLGAQELHVNYHENYKAGLSHFALSMDSDEYHEYYKKIKCTGYEKVSKSHKHVDGLYRFYVDDPYGNTIEITDGNISAKR